MIPQQQRSPAWLKWRKNKVCASEAGVILGVNTFKSIGQLFDEKLGIRQPDEENEAMARGTALEEEARTAFENETGHIVFPQVCIHPEYHWMAASLDGMNIEKDVAVEIKCPGLLSHLRTKSHGIPNYYIPQLQHQMAVTGLKEIYYFSYFPESGNPTILIKHYRDDEYIENLIKKELQFYEILIEGIESLELKDLAMDGFKERLYNILKENE